MEFPVIFIPEIGIYSEYLEFILSFWCHFLRLIPFNPSFWMQLFRVSGCYFFQKLALQRISGHIYSQNLVLYQARKAKISI